MIKIRFFRRIIYIGETGGEVIYLDTEKNMPLKTEKSKLLNTEKAGLQLKYIVPLMLIFSFIRKIGYGYFKTHNNILIILLLVCFVCLGLTFILEHGLYKNVKKAELATKKEFGQAVRSNNIWSIFSDRKVTKGKKVFVWIITVLINFGSITYLFILFDMIRNGELLGNKIEFEFFISLVGGVNLFISILLIWQNNPIRWFNIVEKYQKRKLWR